MRMDARRAFNLFLACNLERDAGEEVFAVFVMRLRKFVMNTSAGSYCKV